MPVPYRHSKKKKFVCNYIFTAAHSFPFTDTKKKYLDDILTQTGVYMKET